MPKILLENLQSLVQYISPAADLQRGALHIYRCGVGGNWAPDGPLCSWRGDTPLTYLLFLALIDYKTCKLQPATEPAGSWASYCLPSCTESWTRASFGSREDGSLVRVFVCVVSFVKYWLAYTHAGHLASRSFLLILFLFKNQSISGTSFYIILFCCKVFLAEYCCGNIGLD